ncbi:MAG: serine/threonine protein kinase [Deltaproteobacteria bacterium]|nr:serine/threonine protein kinase [Deltaproteobacteria bacterium]
MAAEVGSRLGPYVVEARLATGGMAEVFVAKRVGPYGFQKRVALKRIVPRYARDPEFVAMFIDEARLAARLSHPNIVQIFDFGEHGDDLFLAMEYIEGTNLNRVLRGAVAREADIPIDVALYISREVARALASAHSSAGDDGKPLGIVHRDVSPANILLSSTGDVKLSDFGIARAADIEHRTDAGHLRGKLGYMSPEQVVGSKLDARSDQFTLGVVLAEMLLLEPLFGTGTDLAVLLRIRDADLSVLYSVGKRVPADVKEMLERMLARRPEDRYESCAQVADAIEEIARQRRMRMGPARLARLLHKLSLVGDLPPPEVELPATASSTTGDVTTIVPEGQPGGARDIDPANVAAATSPAIYRYKGTGGRLVGPMTYPRLVELFAVGDLDGESLISVADGPFHKARELGELSRFVTSPALRWKDVEKTTATLEGDLSRAVLPRLAHRLAVSRETGLLYLRDGRRRKKIYFVEGKPEFVASTDRNELLGEFLVRKGYCVRMEIEMALALLPRFGGRLGDALVGLGILRPVELFRAIGEQVRLRYLDAFRWRSGKYVYSRGVLSHEETFPLAQDAYELIAQAVSSCYATDEVEATLEPYLDRVLVLEPSPPVPIGVFNVPRGWAQVLESVKGDATLRTVIAREVAHAMAEPEAVYRAVFLAIACGIVRAD